MLLVDISVPCLCSAYVFKRLKYTCQWSIINCLVMSLHCMSIKCSLCLVWIHPIFRLHLVNGNSLNNWELKRKSKPQNNYYCTPTIHDQLYTQLNFMHISFPISSQKQILDICMLVWPKVLKLACRNCSPSAVFYLHYNYDGFYCLTKLTASDF